MFIDEATIHVKAGDGGSGCMSFRREKYVPRGGPDGGDGGLGGSILLQATERLHTLYDFTYRRTYKAKNGLPGGGVNRTGGGGDDLVILVPIGTVVHDAKTGMVLCDLEEDNQTWVAARGGKGGKGNAFFATPTHRAPREYQPGIPGEERELRLELRLLADAGLVGFPNAGKSTFIACVSAARPKIAGYPFTTLVPNLGVVALDDERRMILADIPGLIEGAHEGHGLGLQFLRHLSRTKVLIHLVDTSPDTGRDPVEDYKILNKELRLFSKELAAKPQIVVANKSDLPGSEEGYQRLVKTLKRKKVPVYRASGATGSDIRPVLEAAWKILQDKEDRGQGSRGK